MRWQLMSFLSITISIKININDKLLTQIVMGKLFIFPVLLKTCNLRRQKNKFYGDTWLSCEGSCCISRISDLFLSNDNSRFSPYLVFDPVIHRDSIQSWFAKGNSSGAIHAGLIALKSNLDMSFSVNLLSIGALFIFWSRKVDSQKSDLFNFKFKFIFRLRVQLFDIFGVSIYRISLELSYSCSIHCLFFKPGPRETRTCAMHIANFGKKWSRHF